MSNVAGALTSLLMSLPLVAVPCLAVFGLPSIGPATAEAEADESFQLAAQDDLGVAADAPANATTPDAAFAPIVDAGGAGDAPAFTPTPTAPPADRSQIDPTSDHRGAVANSPAGLKPAAPPEEKPFEFVAIDEKPAASAPPAQTAAAPASWEASIARLTALGIKDFHLTNGETPGEFYFTCSVRSARNVTQRFEAEGPNPAAVAQDVLVQVEKWQTIH